MTPRAYLTARPLSFGYPLPQEDGVAWMKAALTRASQFTPVVDLDRALRLYDLLGRRSAIASRRTALEDYTHQDWDRMRVHVAPHIGDGQATETAAPWYFASLDARLEVFAETAEAVARDAFAGDAEPPDALLQVSCTGYDSPSAVQRLVAARGWADRTRILSVGHMGCYAALPALATAADLATATAARRVAAGDDAPGGADARAAVLLVETCTLHHHPATTDPDQIVQQVLFADGAARLDVTVQAPPEPHFALLDHFEAIVPDTLDEMTWRPANGGFRMSLSRDVPAHIRAHVAESFGAFLARNGLGVDDLDVLAVHPGGPRVIESTAEALGVGEGRVRHSQGVLRDRGNMSSTTLPHIWDRVLHDDDVPAGALVGSVAFGPGLTVTGNLLRKG